MRRRAITHQSANHTAQVEDHPEPGDEATLLRFGRIGHHDGALRRPEDTGAHSEERTGEDNVPKVGGVVVAEVGRDVNGVADATKRQRPADADGIGDGAGEEADNRKGRVESCVGVVASRGVELTCTSETIDGIEHSCLALASAARRKAKCAVLHTRTKEAHKSH